MATFGSILTFLEPFPFSLSQVRCHQYLPVLSLPVLREFAISFSPHLHYPTPSSVIAAVRKLSPSIFVFISLRTRSIFNPFVCSIFILGSYHWRLLYMSIEWQDSSSLQGWSIKELICRHWCTEVDVFGLVKTAECRHKSPNPDPLWNPNPNCTILNLLF